MTVASHERVLRGIPRWLLRGYLEELGGRVVQADQAGEPVAEEDVLAGAGWTARLTQIEDYQIGSLRSGQVRLTVSGEPDALAAMLTRLEPRLFRGGG